MESAVRLVRLIQVAMLASILLYAAIGEWLGRKQAPEKTLLEVFSLAAITMVGAILVVRRTLVVQSEHLLRQRPNDKLTLARWRTGYVVIYVMCAALAILGLILRMLGFPIAHIWGFYAGGFVLLLLFSPRVPCSEFD